MDSRTYSPVTAAQTAEFLEQAKSNGLDITSASPTSGTVSGYGAVVSYDYQENSQELILTVQQHPPFLESLVWSQVEHRLPPGVSRA